MVSSEDKYLNPNEIYEICETPFNVIKFKDFKKFKTIDEAFQPSVLGIEYLPVDNVLILYETKNNVGHWCVLKRLLAKGYTEYYNYHFMDSYGEIIDNQRNHIPKNFRKLSQQDTPLILEKLYLAQNDIGSKYPALNIHYNDKQLQGPTSSTCGRYAGLFMKYDTTVENFVKQLKILAKKKKISVDELVIQLTSL